MIRGTTPTLTFKMPFTCDCLAEAWVTLAQNDTVILDKELKDCEIDGNTLTLHLTQEDTLALACNCTTQVQVRCRTTEGQAMASQIYRVYTDKILKDGEI